MGSAPLFWALGAIVLLGVLIPFIVLGIIDIDDVEPTGLTGSLVSFIESGINVTLFNFTFFGFNISPDINFNLFSFLGDTIIDTLVNYLIAFSLIPIWILVPLLIFIIVGIVVSVISLLLGGG